jgi:hypothetical protein
LEAVLQTLVGNPVMVVRIPTHSVGCSDNIRSVIPGYPVT